MFSKRLNLYLLFAFIPSWLIAGAVWLAGISLLSVTATLLLVVYMYMPALSVFIVKKLIYKEEIKSSLKISFKINKWFLWALLIPIIVLFIALMVGFAFPGIHFDPEMKGMFEIMKERLSPEKYEEMVKSYKSLPVHPAVLGLIQGLVSAVTINALAAFGEELGWRGFLVEEFKSMKFVKASLGIGFIWGIWHAPIILLGHNYPQHPEWGVLFMTIFCILYTFLFIYITLKARSVIAAAVMHGSVNAFAGFTMMFSNRSSDLLIGVTGLAGLIVLVLAIAILFIYDRWVSKEKLLSGTLESAMK